MASDAAMFDRAAGVLLGGAVADALVAGPTWLPVGLPMLRTGEWTEATGLVLSLADVAAKGEDLRAFAANDRLAAEWWGVADRVLLWAGPLGLAYLGRPNEAVAAAAHVAASAHLDPELGEACALWAVAIQHAVRTGELDALVGLAALPAPRRDAWAARLEAAEAAAAESFDGSAAAAWSLIARTPVLVYDPEQHLADTAAAAARLGRGVVAVLAGALAGAVHGAGAVPVEWAEQLHGSGGRRALDLIDRARAMAIAAPVADSEDLLRGL